MLGYESEQRASSWADNGGHQIFHIQNSVMIGEHVAQWQSIGCLNVLTLKGGGARGGNLHRRSHIPHVYAGRCMRSAEKYSYRKRTFLMPASTGIPSYVLAEVESSNEGEYTCGHYMITLADCRRQIQLEFPLANPSSRRHSLAKIDLLLEVLIAFGTALQKEAQLIADRSQQTTKRQKRRQGSATRENGD